MNFDFGWFLTVPGLLITGGSILLVIALIMMVGSIVYEEKINISKQPSQSVNLSVENEDLIVLWKTKARLFNLAFVKFIRVKY